MMSLKGEALLQMRDYIESSFLDDPTILWLKQLTEIKGIL
jgi:hypothetical protein